MPFHAWKPKPSSMVSSKSLSTELEEISVIRLTSSIVWEELDSTKDEVFYRLAVSGKVSTTDVLGRKGLSLETISELCVLCGKEMETIDHLFLHCEFAFSLWCYFLKRRVFRGACLVRWQGCLRLKN